MGAVGVYFDLTYGLDKAWDIFQVLRIWKCYDIFAYDRSIVTDDLAKMRYENKYKTRFPESFLLCFQHLDKMVLIQWKVVKMILKKLIRGFNYSWKRR